MKTLLFNMLAGPVSRLFGSRNLARAAAFIGRAARLDVRNDMATNGELQVQSRLLESTTASALVIVDCGANRGDWSAAMLCGAATAAPNTHIHLHCFEPSAYTFTQLQQALPPADWPQATLHKVNAALASETGTRQLFVAHEGAGSNSLTAVPGTARTEETVQLKRLDDYLEQVIAKDSTAHIDFLKIDAEGNDCDVLLGGGEALARQAIGVIQFEYNWRWIYAGFTLRQAMQLLQGYGYRVGKVTPRGIQFYDGYDYRLETFVEGNYLACSAAQANCFDTVEGWL